MRPIKFRGKNIKTGEIHYGFYSECTLSGGRTETCIMDSQYHGWEVEPESVAQLVGYDADGNEVYEDDTLINLEYGYEDHDFVTVCYDGYYLGDQFFGYKLKK